MAECAPEETKTEKPQEEVVQDGKLKIVETPLFYMVPTKHTLFSVTC